MAVKTRGRKIIEDCAWEFAVNAVIYGTFPISCLHRRLPESFPSCFFDNDDALIYPSKISQRLTFA
jgi:hypothetical protein